MLPAGQKWPAFFVPAKDAKGLPFHSKSMDTQNRKNYILYMDKNKSTTTRPNEMIVGYNYYDAGNENANPLNGRRMFWVIERLSRDAGKTTYNGKTVLCSGPEIELYKQAGMKMTEIEG